MEEEKEKNSTERMKVTGAKECRGMELEETGISPQMSLWQYLGEYFARDILVTYSAFFLVQFFSTFK